MEKNRIAAVSGFVLILRSISFAAANLNRECRESTWTTADTISKGLLRNGGYSSIQDGALKQVTNNGVSSTNPSTTYGALYFNGLQTGIVLGRSDAVVIVYCLPPPVRYHGFTASALHRQKPASWMAHASYSDSLNHLLLNTTRTSTDADELVDDAVEESPWNEQAIIVVTADGRTLEDVKDVLSDAGVSTDSVNLLLIPENAGAIERDSILIVSRTSIPISTSANPLITYAGLKGAPLAEYLKAKAPAFIVRSKRSAYGGLSLPARQPLSENFNNDAGVHGVGGLRHSGTGETEAYLEPALRELAQVVRSKLAATMGGGFKDKSGWGHVTINRSRCLYDRFYNPFSMAGSLRGYQIPGCYAETSDASYVVGDATFAATPSLVIAMVGVNHYMTGKAAFQNTVVYKQPTSRTALAALQLQVLADVDDRSFANSSGFWTSAADTSWINIKMNLNTKNDTSASTESILSNKEYADKLYVHIFVGRRGLCPKFIPQSHCTVVPPQPGGGRVLLIERAYMEPATRTKPLWSELLDAKILQRRRTLPRMPRAIASLTGSRAAGGNISVTARENAVAPRGSQTIPEAADESSSSSYHSYKPQRDEYSHDYDYEHEDQDQMALGSPPSQDRGSSFLRESSAGSTRPRGDDREERVERTREGHTRARTPAGESSRTFTQKQDASTSSPRMRTREHYHRPSGNDRGAYARGQNYGSNID